MLAVEQPVLMWKVVMYSLEGAVAEAKEEGLVLVCLWLAEVVCWRVEE